MSLNAAIEAALPYLQAEEEARQTDTCRITRPGEVSEGDFNPETGQYGNPDPVVVYEGPCRIPPRDSGASSGDARAGEADWQVGEFPLRLPLSDPTSADVLVGHTVTYLTAAHDPALEGNVYGITGIADVSQATARRFRMKRVTGN